MGRQTIRFTIQQLSTISKVLTRLFSLPRPSTMPSWYRPRRRSGVHHLSLRGGFGFGGGGLGGGGLSATFGARGLFCPASEARCRLGLQPWLRCGASTGFGSVFGGGGLGGGDDGAGCAERQWINYVRQLAGSGTNTRHIKIARTRRTLLLRADSAILHRK